MPHNVEIDETLEKTEIQSSNGEAHQSTSEPFPAVVPPYYQPGLNWRWIIWIGLGTLAAILLVAYGRAIFLALPAAGVEAGQPQFAGLLNPTPSAAPSATPTAQARNVFTFFEPTATPTPVPGGRVVVLTPEQKDAGWVVSDEVALVSGNDPQNYFGDSFLYVGIVDGRVYHAAIQFDLGRIPRGTKIYAASLRLTGLRSDLLREGERGLWRLQFLAPEIDYHWRSVNFQEIHKAQTWDTMEPPLVQDQLGPGRINLFEFNPGQLAFLERRLLESSEQFGQKVSFRLDGPQTGADNLFAWDSGYGPASKKAGPQLFLSLGPPPLETPPPYYVVVTSTPTPENVLTAAANSLHLTAEATRIGTATPLPPNWVTPLVVTSTPTAENQATTEVMIELATAIALTTGVPPNMVTATPTSTGVSITSAPTTVVLTTTTFTPSPTNTPATTPSAVPITVEPQPSPSPTATLTSATTGPAVGGFIYAAPVPQSPPDAESFTGPDEVAVLSWSPIDSISPADVYLVTVVRHHGTDGDYADYQLTQDTLVTVPGYIYYDIIGPRDITWHVEVIRNGSLSDTFRPIGEIVSPKSEPRIFIWNAIGDSVGGDGGGTGQIVTPSP
jgi:hypothetical protein